VGRLFQIRTITERKAVPLGGSLDRVRGDYWLIVKFSERHSPATFVMLPSEVKERATRDKGGKRDWWLEPREFVDAEFYERWERIR
jgi:hypothetical protein